MNVGDFVKKGDEVGEILMINEGLLSVKVGDDYFTWSDDEVTLVKEDQVIEIEPEIPKVEIKETKVEIKKKKPEKVEEGWSAGRWTRMSALLLGVTAILGL